MRIRRLGWAGIEVSAQDTSLVVDYGRRFWDQGNAVPRDGFADLSRPGQACAALVTHLHADHTEVAAIQSAVGPKGLVLRPRTFVGSAEEGVVTARQEADLAASTLNVRVVSDWERVEVPTFTGSFMAATPCSTVTGGSSRGGPGRSTLPSCRSTERR
jgi:L-ascorbate metabolism protein UlaG (beta-lactamase superfamily)